MICFMIDNCRLSTCINNVNRHCYLSGKYIDHKSDKDFVSKSQDCQVNQQRKIEKTKDLINDQPQ